MRVVPQSGCRRFEAADAMRLGLRILAINPPVSAPAGVVRLAVGGQLRIMGLVEMADAPAVIMRVEFPEDCLELEHGEDLVNIPGGDGQKAFAWCLRARAPSTSQRFVRITIAEGEHVVQESRITLEVAAT